MCYLMFLIVSSLTAAALTPLMPLMPLKPLVKPRFSLSPGHKKNRELFVKLEVLDYLYTKQESPRLMAASVSAFSLV